jgi:hypothetical protein
MVCNKRRLCDIDLDRMSRMGTSLTKETTLTMFLMRMINLQV